MIKYLVFATEDTPPEAGMTVEWSSDKEPTDKDLKEIFAMLDWESGGCSSITVCKIEKMTEYTEQTVVKET